MGSMTKLWGWGFLAMLALLALLAPYLPLPSPTEISESVVLRDLPPMARVDLILLADGSRVHTNEIETDSDQSLSYRQGTEWHSIPTTALAGQTEDDWHRTQRFILGTDRHGRDLASRLLHGARISLLIGLMAASIAVVIGIIVGLVSAMAGGLVDSLLMRFTDLVLAIPRLFLALMLVALWGTSLTTTTVVLGTTTWMAAARLVRGEVLAAKGLDYVEAARAGGAAPLRLGIFHLLPAALVPVIVEGALRVGDSILLETSLSFLGLGVPPPLASWGNLIRDGLSSLRLGIWWTTAFPVIALACTVISFTVIGQSLQQRLSGNKTE
jgi:peptide/nickel transport system permease protein